MALKASKHRDPLCKLLTTEYGIDRLPVSLKGHDDVTAEWPLQSPTKLVLSDPLRTRLKGALGSPSEDQKQRGFDQQRQQQLRRGLDAPQGMSFDQATAILRLVVDGADISSGPPFGFPQPLRYWVVDPSSIPAELKPDDVGNSFSLYDLVGHNSSRFDGEKPAEPPPPDISASQHPLPATILRALRTKPFVLLPGISGTGKTQLARRLAGWAVRHGTCGPELLERDGVTGGHGETIFGVTDPDAQGPPSEDAGQRIAFLPVRPDWTEASMFWGYYNPLTGFYYPTPATRVLLDAWQHFVSHPERATRSGPTHFLILDEMNLARVEYYFSDLLSLMEAGPRQHDDHWTSGEVARIHDFAAPLRVQSRDNEPGPPPHLAPERLPEPAWLRALLLEGRGNARIDAGDAARDGLQGAGTEWVPPFLPYPPNLAILGTVNIDETTHAFSPKVLDRAFVFEFLQWGTPGLEEPTTSSGDDRPFAATLHALNRVLRKSRHHFGHRVFNEACQFLGARDDAALVDAAQLDWLVLTRILPKIRGSRGEVGTVLEELTNELDGESFPLSHQKLQDMTQRLGDTGFTAYF